MSTTDTAKQTENRDGHAKGAVDRGVGVAAFRLFERVAVILVWILVIIGFSIALPQAFPTWANFSVMFSTNAPLALLALAIIVPLTAGDYDLAVAATATLSAMLVAVLNVWEGLPIGLVLVICMAMGALIGLIHAFFIVYIRIHSLVVTLATTTLFIGIVLWISGSQTISRISPWLGDVVRDLRIFGISMSFYYAVLVALVLWYVFEYTPLGRRLLFVGRGREVARLSGINVGLMRSGALVASSMIAALAGIVYVGTLGSADPNSLREYLLPAFAAAFLGATVIVPGRFNPWGAIIAVYFLATGITGLTMLGIPLWVTFVFNGTALLLAVTLSQFTRGRVEADF